MMNNSIWDLMSDQMKGIIMFTVESWKGSSIKVLNIEHILHTMIKKNVEIVKKVFDHFNIDINDIKKDIEDSNFMKGFVPNDKRTHPIARVNFDVSIVECIAIATKFISKLGNSNKRVNSEHFFLAMCIAESSKLSVYFSSLGISPEVVKEFILSEDSNNLLNTIDDVKPDDDNSIIDKNSSNNAGVDTMDPEDYEKYQQKQKLSEMRPSNPNKTPTLEELGVNMVERVKNGSIDKVIGRDKETEMLMEILCRKNKRNVLLIGEPGVGKTAIVEGFAINLFKHNVPLKLKDKRLYQLDTVSLVSGTVFRGQFEQRMKMLVEELVNAKNTIVFIDEFHTILGSGNSAGGADISNILKPELSRGNIQVIGATTQDEYQKYILKDKALERRFQVINVSEPSEESALDILTGLRVSYEKYHNVEIDDSALTAAVRLSKQYIPSRYLPDKCIDLIDIASARPQMDSMNIPTEIKDLREEVDRAAFERDEAARNGDAEKRIRMHRKHQELEDKLKKLEDNYYNNLSTTPAIITDQNVAEAVSRLTGIPSNKITESDASKLLNLENNLKEHVIGQDEAISVVTKAVKRARTDLHDRKKPIGCFLFMGPTGVGKTELARRLAVELFGKETNLLKFDMSEYSERYDINKLVGSAPSFIGHDEGGNLTNAIRNNPYSIVLFDEIEKAHKDVYNLFLQIFEDGELTDGKGRKVFFNNSIIIMTSNIGAEKAYNYNGRFGFGEVETSEDKNKAISKIMREEVENRFRPEFLNRLDDIVSFNRLNHEDVRKILDIQIDKLNKRIEYRDMKILLTDNMKDHIIKEGYNEKYGARPINRAIQNTVEDYLADKLLTKEIDDGMKVELDFVDGKIVHSLLTK